MKISLPFAILNTSDRVLSLLTFDLVTSKMPLTHLASNNLDEITFPVYMVLRAFE